MQEQFPFTDLAPLVALSHQYHRIRHAIVDHYSAPRVNRSTMAQDTRVHHASTASSRDINCICTRFDNTHVSRAIPSPFDASIAHTAMNGNETGQQCSYKSTRVSIESVLGPLTEVITLFINTRTTVNNAIIVFALCATSPTMDYTADEVDSVSQWIPGTSPCEGTSLLPWKPHDPQVQATSPVCSTFASKYDHIRYYNSISQSALSIYQQLFQPLHVIASATSHIYSFLLHHIQSMIYLVPTESGDTDSVLLELFTQFLHLITIWMPHGTAPLFASATTIPDIANGPDDRTAEVPHMGMTACHIMNGVHAMVNAYLCQTVTSTMYSFLQDFPSYLSIMEKDYHNPQQMGVERTEIEVILGNAVVLGQKTHYKYDLQENGLSTIIQNSITELKNKNPCNSSDSMNNGESWQKIFLLRHLLCPWLHELLVFSTDMLNAFHLTVIRLISEAPILDWVPTLHFTLHVITNGVLGWTQLSRLLSLTPRKISLAQETMTHGCVLSHTARNGFTPTHLIRPIMYLVEALCTSVLQTRGPCILSSLLTSPPSCSDSNRALTYGYDDSENKIPEHGVFLQRASDLINTVPVVYHIAHALLDYMGLLYTPTTVLRLAKHTRLSIHKNTPPSDAPSDENTDLDAASKAQMKQSNTTRHRSPFQCHYQQGQSKSCTIPCLNCHGYNQGKIKPKAEKGGMDRQPRSPHHFITASPGSILPRLQDSYHSIVDYLQTNRDELRSAVQQVNAQIQNECLSGSNRLTSPPGRELVQPVSMGTSSKPSNTPPPSPPDNDGDTDDERFSHEGTTHPIKRFRPNTTADIVTATMNNSITIESTEGGQPHTPTTHISPLHHNGSPRPQAHPHDSPQLGMYISHLHTMQNVIETIGETMHAYQFCKTFIDKMISTWFHLWYWHLFVTMSCECSVGDDDLPCNHPPGYHEQWHQTRQYYLHSCSDPTTCPDRIDYNMIYVNHYGLLSQYNFGSDNSPNDVVAALAGKVAEGCEGMTTSITRSSTQMISNWLHAIDTCNDTLPIDATLLLLSIGIEFDSHSSIAELYNTSSLLGSVSRVAICPYLAFIMLATYFRFNSDLFLEHFLDSPALLSICTSYVKLLPSLAAAGMTDATTISFQTVIQSILQIDIGNDLHIENISCDDGSNANILSFLRSLFLLCESCAIHEQYPDDDPIEEDMEEDQSIPPPLPQTHSIVVIPLPSYLAQREKTLPRDLENCASVQQQHQSKPSTRRVYDDTSPQPTTPETVSISITDQYPPFDEMWVMEHLSAACELVQCHVASADNHFIHYKRHHLQLIEQQYDFEPYDESGMNSQQLGHQPVESHIHGNPHRFSRALRLILCMVRFTNTLSQKARYINRYHHFKWEPAIKAIDEIHTYYCRLFDHCKLLQYAVLWAIDSSDNG